MTILAQIIAAVMVSSVLGASDSQISTTNSEPCLVVIELFSSQNCAMCPKANAFLGELGEDENALVLAYSVDYWDPFANWTDQFARPEFVARQEAYIETGQANRVFTPHFIVNGSPEKLKFHKRRIRQTVENTPPLSTLITAKQTENVIEITLTGPEREAPAELWRVDYMKGPIDVDVTNGPNKGRSLNHYNVVRSIERLGEWSGAPLTLNTQISNEGLASAILVQDGPGGPIVSATRVSH